MQHRSSALVPLRADSMSAAGTASLTEVTPGKRSDLPRRRRFRDALSGVLGGILGLAPHVLHHVGLLAGTALVAGSGGTALFGALGLVASLPLLRRLHRRFGTWRAPAVGLALFTAMFALSAYLIGPAISGDDATAPADHVVEHEEHE